jgi:ABC-type transport system substrate-binding protein
VFKLNQPYAPLLTQLANGSVSYFYIIPKEGKAQTDPNSFSKYQFGGGPFMVDSVEPSVKLVLQKARTTRHSTPT